MKPRLQPPAVRRITVGDAITARWLNSLVAVANSSLDSGTSPESDRNVASADTVLEVADDPETQEQPPEITARVWTEVDRVTSTVRVSDPNDETIFVDVDRIDKVTFESSGETLTLVFLND